jgi:hypothetical protein
VLRICSSLVALPAGQATILRNHLLKGKSPFLSLIDLLRSNTSAELEQISIFSYGSGCTASMNIAYPTPGFERFRDKINPEPELSARRKLSIAEYENAMKTHDSLGTGDTEEFSASEWDLTSDFLYLGNRNDVRRYSALDRGSSEARQSDLMKMCARYREVGYLSYILMGR